MSDVIIETEKYRVIAEPDYNAEEPYDDGATPTLRIDFSNRYGRHEAVAFNSQAKPYVDAFNKLSYVFSGDQDVSEIFERYLKIFHGTAKVQSFGLNDTRATDSTYLAFDTATWRDYMGCTKENVAKEDYLSEIRSWIEGDVYTLVLQKKVIWTTEDEDYEDREEWENVDSVGGLYGEDGLEESAKWYFTEELEVTD